MAQNIDKILLLLILVTGLISYKGFNDFGFFEKYKFQINKILNGELIRMLSSGFLHVDWFHLIFNMYALYLFGDIVIGRLGVFYFLVIYFGSLLFGSFYSIFYHKKEPYYSAVGASGAISGIVYSSIMIYPEIKLYLLFIPLPIPGYIFGIGYLLYSIYGIKKKIGNIGHSAHFGGAVGGFIISIIVEPILVLNSPILSLFLLTSIILLYFFKIRKD